MPLATSPLGSVSSTSIGLLPIDPPSVSTTVSTYVSLPVSSPAAKFVGDEDELIVHAGPSAYAGAAAALPTPNMSNTPLATNQP
ncbi:MAG TPA: hypothetical protein VIJ39_10990 [Solirubrobacteraceae bacterium]